MSSRRAATIRRHGKVYTVTRRGPSTRVNGVVVPPVSSTSVAIIASIQPVTGDMLMELPEGQRPDETRVVYTVTELFTRSNDHSPDELTFDGATWYVYNVAKWDALGETHYVAMVSKKAL